MTDFLFFLCRVDFLGGALGNGLIFFRENTVTLSDPYWNFVLVLAVSRIGETTKLDMIGNLWLSLSVFVDI